MRTWLTPFAMVSPRTLEDALALLADGSGWKPFAGGTDLMVLLEAARLPPTRFVNVWSIEELRPITVSEGVLSIGALATYTDLLEHDVLRREFPLVGEAARQTGATAIQNRGTVGGNIANASPAADLPPALLAYDAEIELVSSRGARRLPYAAFHKSYKVTELRSDELIKAVHLRRPEGTRRQAYRKVGTRRAQAISKVCFAATIRLEDGVVRDVRIALGSVAPVPIRATGAEAALASRPLNEDVIADARRALAADVAPIDDVRSTAAYRRLVAGNLLEEFLA